MQVKVLPPANKPVKRVRKAKSTQALPKEVKKQRRQARRAKFAKVFATADKDTLSRKQKGQLRKHLVRKFWAVYDSRLDASSRKNLLIQYAQSDLFTCTPEYLRNMRYRYNRLKHGPQFQFAKVCGVCTGAAVHRHHIIPLANGGGNSKHNLIPLCHPCHEEVHGFKI
jgi:hypothetical protein